MEHGRLWGIYLTTNIALFPLHTKPEQEEVMTLQACHHLELRKRAGVGSMLWIIISRTSHHFYYIRLLSQVVPRGRACMIGHAVAWRPGFGGIPTPTS